MRINVRPIQLGLRSIAAVLFATMLVSSPASATIINLTASLDCAQVNAGVGSCGAGGSGTGSATITLDDTTDVLSWNVTWSGLGGSVTGAHFHGPAFPNQNAGPQVAITLASPSIGNTVIGAVQQAELLAGLWYLNIHSSTFPGGEIRGQVVVVPEPNTALLLSLGLLGLTAKQRQHLK